MTEELEIVLFAIAAVGYAVFGWVILRLLWNAGSALEAYTKSKKKKDI